MEGVTWKYYPFPNKLIQFTTYACIRRKHYGVDRCIDVLNKIKVTQSAP